MKVCVEKLTGKLIEASSSSDEKTLIDNALGFGCGKDDVEVKDITREEYKEFLLAVNKPAPREAAKKELAATDAGMSRVVEDLVTALLAKGILKEADLPQAVIDKISTRKELRTSLKG